MEPREAGISLHGESCLSPDEHFVGLLPLSVLDRGMAQHAVQLYSSLGEPTRASEFEIS